MSRFIRCRGLMNTLLACVYVMIHCGRPSAIRPIIARVSALLSPASTLADCGRFVVRPSTPLSRRHDDTLSAAACRDRCFDDLACVAYDFAPPPSDHCRNYSRQEAGSPVRDAASGAGHYVFTSRCDNPTGETAY